MKKLTIILTPLLIIGTVACAQDKKTNVDPKGNPNATVPTKTSKIATKPITVDPLPAKTKSVHDTATGKKSKSKISIGNAVHENEWPDRSSN